MRVYWLAPRKRWAKGPNGERGGKGDKVEFPRLELRIISMITHFSRHFRTRERYGKERERQRGADNFRDMRFNGAKVTNN